MWAESNRLKIQNVTSGFCKHGDEHSGFIKRKKFLDQLNQRQRFKVMYDGVSFFCYFNFTECDLLVFQDFI